MTRPWWLTSADGRTNPLHGGKSVIFTTERQAVYVMIAGAGGYTVYGNIDRPLEAVSLRYASDNDARNFTTQIGSDGTTMLEPWYLSWNILGVVEGLRLVRRHGRLYRGTEHGRHLSRGLLLDELWRQRHYGIQSPFLPQKRPIVE